jgi:hypothetical protein
MRAVSGRHEPRRACPPNVRRIWSAAARCLPARRFLACTRHRPPAARRGGLPGRPPRRLAASVRAALKPGGGLASRCGIGTAGRRARSAEPFASARVSRAIRLGRLRGSGSRYDGAVRRREPWGYRTGPIPSSDWPGSRGEKRLSSELMLKRGPSNWVRACRQSLPAARCFVAYCLYVGLEASHRRKAPRREPES